MNEIDVESLAKKAIKDKKLLSELLQGILSKKDEIRYNSFKILLLISEEHPEILYHKWGFFEDLLNSDNNYQKLIAIRLIANLTRVDSENKFEKIFDEYYGILEGERTMTAGHLTATSGKIVKAKPELEARITDRLLDIDKTHHHPDRRDLIKAGVMEAFNEYFAEAREKGGIIEFVKQQLNSTSPKSRKVAKQFLREWDKKSYC